MTFPEQLHGSVTVNRLCCNSVRYTRVRAAPSWSCFRMLIDIEIHTYYSEARVNESRPPEQNKGEGFDTLAMIPL